jgi:hypothetical protein
MAVRSEPQISRVKVVFLRPRRSRKEDGPERAMATFDYNAEAELFPPRLRKSPHRRFGYRRFARAADAVRFAIEELPPELLLGAVLEVDGERYGREDIRRLYDRADFPSLPQAA